MATGRWHRYERRTARWIRHAEFNFIVPFGIVAAMFALLVGIGADLLAIVGLGIRNRDMTYVPYQQVLYGTVLPGVAALFFVFCVFKVRFLWLRLLLSLTALGMASRIVMTWKPLEHARLITTLRLSVSTVLVICCWLYDRRFQSERLEHEGVVVAAAKVQRR